MNEEKKEKIIAVLREFCVPNKAHDGILLSAVAEKILLAIEETK
jgi:hypothetical protein